MIPREAKKETQNTPILAFYHEFIHLTSKVKTFFNIKMLLCIYTYLLSVYLQVLLNCVREISLIVGRRKVELLMVIHISVGEDHILSKKTFVFTRVCQTGSDFT